jgi:hypothetical protein
LLGRAVGDVVALNSETTTRQYEIRSIEPGPIDVAPAESGVEIPAEAAIAS